MIRGSSSTGGSGKPSPRYYCADCTGAGSVTLSKMHDKFLLAFTKLLYEEADQLKMEISELKEQRSLSEIKIKALITVMESPATIWWGLSLKKDSCFSE